MRLIAIERPGRPTAVMHYLRPDGSRAAITTEIKRVAPDATSWQEITREQYEALRRTR